GSHQDRSGRAIYGRQTEAVAVIIDLHRFVAAERTYWEELDGILKGLDSEPERRLTLAEIQRLQYLYERASSDLSRLDTFSTEPSVRESLESLVSRAYMEIHESRTPLKIHWKDIVLAFPRAFRRRMGAFQLSVAVTVLGCAFGWFAIHQDPRTKAVLMPFPGLMQTPAELVHQEESVKGDRLKGVKA